MYFWIAHLYRCNVADLMYEFRKGVSRWYGVSFRDNAPIAGTTIGKSYLYQQRLLAIQSLHFQLSLEDGQP